MANALLAINAGSSSLKFALFAIAGDAPGIAHCRGQIENLQQAPHFVARGSDGKTLADESWDAEGGEREPLARLLHWIGNQLQGDRLAAVGHRIVHGGLRFNAPVRVDDDVLQALQDLVPLAPLHQPHNLAPICVLRQHQPELTQVACFDTAFHHTMPAVAKRVGLPREFTEQGLQRYGFHGLSYEYIASELRKTVPALAAGRVIVAHLGNGASLCAMRNGRSVDTTMGFSALDGLMMGTRPGRLDAGVLLYLQQQLGLSVDEVEDLLYHRSGLLGVSGLSNDVRELLASDAPQAREAIELFVFRLVREIGAMAMSLGGTDGLVFTAGIGEHAAPIRAAACERLGWLGLVLDASANQRGDTLISTPDSSIQVRVVPTDEERTIARHTLAVLRSAP